MNKDAKNGAVLLIVFVVLFAPVIVEIILFPRGPFLMWRFIFEEIKLAKWNMTLHTVGLLFFAFAFLFVAVRLIWRELKH